MENTPKGNQGNEEEVLIAREGMTRQEWNASHNREFALLRLQHEAKRKNISDDVLRQILDTVDVGDERERNYSAMINGISIEFRPAPGDRGPCMVIFNDGSSDMVGIDAIEKQELTHAVLDKYYDIFAQAYYLKKSERKATIRVRTERSRLSEKGKSLALSIKKLL